MQYILLLRKFQTRQSFSCVILGISIWRWTAFISFYWMTEIILSDWTSFPILLKI